VWLSRCPSSPTIAALTSMALTLSLIEPMLSGPSVPSRGPLNFVRALSVDSTQSLGVW
jgi:hypothetical protein